MPLLAIPMRIYEASIAYNVVQQGPVEPLNTPEKIVDYLRDAFERQPMVETLWLICLNRKNRPIGRTLITSGTLTGSLVHPREVFMVAVLSSAAAIVVAHNHPGGDPAPSSADLQVTRRLHEAATAMDIELIDHVIVGLPEDDPAGRGFYSFRSAGLL